VTAPTLEAGRLTLLCADLDARPLFWTGTDGGRHGFEPAVADAVAARIGLETCWQFRRWADLEPALETGAADAIWCGCAITPERAARILFSRPYAIFHESVLVRRGAGITATDDLRGKRVGAIAASTNMRLAERWPGCERIGFDGNSDDVFADMVGALRRGDIDALVDDEPAFGGLLADGEFEIAFTVQTGNRWAAALPPGAGALKAALDDALAAVIDDGELRDIWNRWLEPIEYPDGFARAAD
jgi:polar amino acid transport system substrate-binding protein